jgi:hypothetical protein
VAHIHSHGEASSLGGGRHGSEDRFLRVLSSLSLGEVVRVNFGCALPAELPQEKDPAGSVACPLGAVLCRERLDVFLPSWSVSPNAYCALLVENKMRAPIIKKPSYQNECRVEVQARSRA